MIEKRFGPVTYQVKVLGVSKQVHADHIVRQPDKLSMPTPVKEGNPTIKSDNAKISVNMDTCTNAHRYNTRCKKKNNCKKKAIVIIVKKI